MSALSAERSEQPKRATVTQPYCAFLQLRYLLGFIEHHPSADEVCHPKQQHHLRDRCTACPLRNS